MFILDLEAIRYRGCESASKPFFSQVIIDMVCHRPFSIPLNLRALLYYCPRDNGYKPSYLYLCMADLVSFCFGTPIVECGMMVRFANHQEMFSYSLFLFPLTRSSILLRKHCWSPCPACLVFFSNEGQLRRQRDKATAQGTFYEFSVF